MALGNEVAQQKLIRGGRGVKCLFFYLVHGMMVY